MKRRCLMLGAKSRAGRPLNDTTDRGAASHPKCQRASGFSRPQCGSFGLNRYLGVPIHDPRGKPIGTFCFLDNRVDIPLGEEDIRFLSLLARRVSAEVERERMV